MRNRAKHSTQFGVCIDNRGYAASLEVGKLYRMIPDEEAAKHGYIRVVDESGEDYGYSVKRFFVLKVPQPLARALTGGPIRRANGPSKASQPAVQKGRRG